MVKRLSPYVSPALFVTGLGFLSAAAWIIALPLGLAAVGVSCLVLEVAVSE